jgi:plasmid stabilization system protein ParE
VRARFLSDAEDEMNEAAAFYESRVVGLGEEFLAEVNACVERILERPKIGRRLRGDIRRLLVTRFPYSVVYATHGETAVVVAVAHLRRRPGYWVRRYP